MRSLPRRLDRRAHHRAFAALATVPALAVAQGTADGAATGASPWNWAVGVAAAAIVIAMAWDLFGPGRRRGGAPPVR